MKLMPKLLCRSGFPDEELSRLKSRLEDFLKRTDLTESALIIDGSGLGCISHFVILSLLGPERYNRFRSVHSVSASCYSVLYFLAWQKDMLSLSHEKIDNFNQANQMRHNIAGWGRGSRLVISFLLGSSYLFSNDRLEEALAYGVNPEFLNIRVSELSENISFLTYCVEDRELCEIRQSSRFADWTLGEVIRCVTAVKGIYAPFRKEGKTYMDAVTDRPQLSELYRNIRNRNRYVLSLHMDRDGIHENTTFIKMHDTGSGRIRVILDFLYFMSGVENRDFGEAIRVGLHQVKPI
ncbi:MAG: hypothetical protein PVH74_04765 [Desulfobacterales bacterium]|jgi:hypothetical protein